MLETDTKGICVHMCVLPLGSGLWYGVHAALHMAHARCHHKTFHMGVYTVSSFCLGLYTVYRTVPAYGRRVCEAVRPRTVCAGRAIQGI